MERSNVGDFILFGSDEPGGRFYVRQTVNGRNVWLAYDVEAKGRLGPPTVVFGGREDGGWRGLPTTTDPGTDR